jgi:hypothetical protein
MPNTYLMPASADLNLQPARVGRDLDHAADPRHWVCTRPLLHRELDRLEGFLAVAKSHPRLWLRAIAGREGPLALWLFGVALGVAQWGCGETALILLDALPGVAGGEAGRRELLREILAIDGLADGFDAGDMLPHHAA